MQPTVFSSFAVANPFTQGWEIQRIICCFPFADTLFLGTTVQEDTFFFRNSKVRTAKPRPYTPRRLITVSVNSGSL